MIDLGFMLTRSLIFVSEGCNKLATNNALDCQRQIADEAPGNSTIRLQGKLVSGRLTTLDPLSVLESKLIKSLLPSFERVADVSTGGSGGENTLSTIKLLFTLS